MSMADATKLSSRSDKKRENKRYGGTAVRAHKQTTTADQTQPARARKRYPCFPRTLGTSALSSLPRLLDRARVTSPIPLPPTAAHLPQTHRSRTDPSDKNPPTANSP